MIKRSIRKTEEILTGNIAKMILLTVLFFVLMVGYRLTGLLP